jgi:hypothetical protein
MIKETIDFYAQVIISDSYPGDKKGRRGVVLGVSEEDGFVHGYAVMLDGENLTIFLEKQYVIPTGKCFSREDFY